MMGRLWNLSFSVLFLLAFSPWTINALMEKKFELHVHIAGFFPTSLNVSEGAVGRGVLPAVKLALFHINQDRRLLDKVKLHITWNNTQCSAADGMKAFFDMMDQPPMKYMLFGDACTSVTDPVAKASKHWKIVQLSYADMHPMFSKKNFPNLYRIVPSENEFNEPRIELMKRFNWTKVGTLYQNKPRYSLAHNKLVADLEKIGVQVVAAQSFSDDIHYQMAKLKEKDVRIILGNFNETWARRIFCAAYQEKLYGRKYQWLIVAAYTTHWWRKRDVNCTVEEVEAALKGAILMDLNPLSTSQNITVSGMTAAQYEELYKIVNLGEYSRFHGYAYDGIWAIALALHNVSKYLHPKTEIGDDRRVQVLRTFEYHNPTWEKAFLNAMEDTFFLGVTGPVRFQDNGRKGSVLIKQFQAFNTVNAEVKIGEYDGVTRTMNLAKGSDIVWNGKNPPKDRTIQVIEQTRVNITLYLALAILSVIGIILAGFFLGVNIKYRNQRYIKMSSPYLNNLIIIGCMLCYCSVMILGLDSRMTSEDAFPYICTARAWSLMAGFTIAFGSMFSKTWRVHSIFTNVKLNKKVIKDMQLFLVVGVLLAVDFVLLILWQFLDPMYRTTKRLESYQSPVNEDIEVIPLNEYCKSDYMTYFMGVIYGYKGLLMMFGCFLAWETRHVSIPALNDSKYIGMSVYNCVMMCVLGAPLSHVLSDQPDAGFLIISGFIIFCTTITLCLVFGPKVIELKRNPKGTVEKRIRATTLLKPASSSHSSHHPSYNNQPSFTNTSNRRGSAASIYETELKTAKQHNLKIRKQIREIDNEIQAIAKLLGKDDAQVQRILQDVYNLVTPKSEVLKKEDTDISSLYSLNSEGGGDVFDYEDEDEEEDEDVPKKKYPGIVQGLAGLAVVNVPHWESTLTKTTLISTEKPEEVKLPPKPTKDKIEEEGSKREDETIPPTEKKSPIRRMNSKSLYEINTLSEVEHEKLKKSSSFDELQKTPKGPSGGVPRTTEDEEMWKRMLQKEQSRYLQRNYKSNSIGEKIVVDKSLKVFAAPGGVGGEIYINGNQGKNGQKPPNGGNGKNGTPPGNGGNGTSTLQAEAESQAFPQKLSKRSYSVPRRLNDRHYPSNLNINSSQISSSSTEINLDVSLLPIFHKLLSEQQRQQHQQQRLSLRDREKQKKNKKFMVSCPNILIKCDIVEYL